MTERENNDVVQKRVTDRLGPRWDRESVTMHAIIDPRDPTNSAVRFQNTLEQITEVLIRFTTDAFCTAELRGEPMDAGLDPLHDALHTAGTACLGALEALSAATGTPSPLVERRDRAEATLEAEEVSSILANLELLTSLFGEEIATDITRWAKAHNN